jgi:putative component of membrane protein insertase Oxa1/YidC/SpoIIIJ protein YidD
MLKAYSIKSIEWYQRKGGSRHFFDIECNFTPTCSAYTKEAIIKHGFLKGWQMGLSRIHRCNQPDVVCKCHDPVN